jgi:tRNA(Arg) A34 adenosine deaminase TadA
MSASAFFPERAPLPDAVTTHALIRESVRVADVAMAEGKHPFGCVLVGPEGEILLEQGNIDTVNHAEVTLARAAAAKYEPAFLWQCTLVTNFEPW